MAQKWDDNCQNYGHRVCGLAEFTRSVGDFEFKLPWAARYFNKLVSHRSQVAVPDEQRPVLRLFPLCVFSSRAQGSSGVVATMALCMARPHKGPRHLIRACA